MLGFLGKKKQEAVPVNRRRDAGSKSRGTATKKAVQRPPSPHAEKVRRASKALLRLLLAGALTAGVVFLGIAGYHHATSAAYFRLTEAEISGNKRLTDEAILSAAGVEIGENIFSIDMVQVRDRLSTSPWVESAEVVRRLPGKIVVRVTERKPRAVVNLDVLYLVDDTGKVFKRWVQGDPIPSPIVTGISREEFLSAPETQESVLCDAIDLADRYANAGGARVAPLQEIHREPDGGFSLTVGNDPVYVKFGKGPYKEKLARLVTLLGKLAGENKRAEQIFFDNEIRPDRITVKLKPQVAKQQSDAVKIAPDEDKKIVSKI